MDFEQISEFHKDQDSDSNLNIRELLDKYSIYWKWFLLAMILAIGLAYLKLSFTRPSYEASSSIKIKNENAGDRSALSAFQDLGLGSLGGTKENVEDEIEIIKSKTLISETIKSLKLNVRLFSNKSPISSFLDNNLNLETEFYEKENYANPPLKINFFISDSTLYKTSASFVIHVNSSSQFTYKNLEAPIERKYDFGQKLTTNFGELVITPLLDLKSSGYIDEDILVSIVPLEDLTEAYLEVLTVEPISNLSNVVTLTIVEGVKKKAEDFLNELVRQYNLRAVRLKEELSQSTSNFVNRRLQIISEELSDVDLSAESIKTKYQISDVASQTGLNMQSGQELERQIVDAGMQLEKISAVKDFVTSKDDNELLPVNLGIEGNVGTLTNQYNDLMLQKKRLLENSTEKNPIVVRLNEQLKTLESNISQGLNNLEDAQKISLDALNKQGARINSRLYAAPKQERQYRDVQRQQQIKEQLYLYLLQKREETAITLGVADPNATIIDAAQSLKNKVAPKKMIIYFGALLLGFLIPFIIIYLKDMLDTMIHRREDVEKILNVPILGDIPKTDSKERYLISKEDHSGVAEAFRILRTNLNFILDSNAKGKTIFITSSIAGEGKSLVASNLATALAHAGKKTLLIGFDIRAPKIKEYLGVRGEIGITNFLANSSVQFDDLIVRNKEIENLDIISSGDLAPNPSELLMNPRVKQLFEIAKEQYEYIIVDTAAFSMVTDTMLLSNNANAFIYVIRANYLDKRFLKYIKTLHQEKRLPNLSLLINGVDHKKSYGYGYGYGYGADYKKSKQKKWWQFS